MHPLSRAATLLVVLLFVMPGLLAACAPTDEDREVRHAKQVSQHGITWAFDREYPVGQFVTGDWWVLGPVKVMSVTPAPGEAPAGEINDLGVNDWGDTGLQDDKQLRNGSMVVMSVGSEQGYDSRGVTFDPDVSITFPYNLPANRSLISSASEVELPNTVMQADMMWSSEKTSNNVMKTAAVLTSLSEIPPADAFRPSYAGGEKVIYRASDLQWNRLLNLPVDREKYDVPEFEDVARYLDRPWIDHLNGAWQGQWLLPVENQPNYGREMARIVGIASLMLNMDATKDEKRDLLYRLVQYGIDLKGLTQLGAVYNQGGGITSGRKWPLIFAGLMLGQPSFVPAPNSSVFHEDAQTYYGDGWYGQSALWQIVDHHGVRQPYQEKPPSEWDKWDNTSETYRTCCTVRAWVGQGLAALLMGAKADWNHSAYFEVIDDWMRKDDIYAANRQGHPRPAEETQTLDPFVDAFWELYRDKAPEQPSGSTDLKWDVNRSQDFKWIPNPRM